MVRRKAVIAGGGLAGLACAKRLVDAELDVVLLEAEPVFGGRATSWVDPSDGEIIETGEHTFFGIYERLSALLEEVGVDLDTILTWKKSVEYLDVDGRYYEFGIDPLRALPRVIRGILGNNDLVGPGDKLTLIGAGLRSIDQWLGDKNDTLATAARRAGVEDETMNRVLRPVSRAILFCEPEEVAASAFVDIALHMASRPTEIRAGTFNGGMGGLMIDPIVEWLRRAGATLRNETRVKEIQYDDENGTVSGVTVDSGDVVAGDVFVSALTLSSLKKVLPPPLRKYPYFDAIAQIPIVPAVSVQLWFDRSIVESDSFVFLPDSSVPVFQDESFITFPRDGSRISCQVTDRTTDGFTDAEYIECALSELSRYIPQMSGATLERTAVVRHEAFASSPDTIQRLRPTQTTPVHNFFVAGDFTDQNWYTTMEGAARSGEMAAEAVVAAVEAAR